MGYRRPARHCRRIAERITFHGDRRSQPPSYTLYLNQRHAVDLTDDHNSDTGNMGFGCLGQGGTVHVTGARAYALP